MVLVVWNFVQEAEGTEVGVAFGALPSDTTDFTGPGAVLSVATISSVFHSNSIVVDNLY